MFDRLKKAWEWIRRELKVYRLVLKDPRTPRMAKFLLALLIAYAASPMDLIPDWIPVLGYVDDLVVLPLLAWLALRMAPDEVIEDCRRKAHQMHRPSAG